MPSCVFGLCMTSVREFIIVYGGYDDQQSRNCNELWIYNTLRDSWRLHKAPAEKENCCVDSAICTFGNSVYIFGGCSISHPVRATNSIITFDIINETWQNISPHIDNTCLNTPPPMFRSCIFYHNGSLYVVGGGHLS
ncbi:hypothetical protein RF11_16439 [Thelohanellus kitauei]|uniref:Uncharacterized protein n=1 Tax=Thelohanellus kitauei TaxID=669202 RepID=A0A0C2MHL5_THEKT|nr:hypothetical protein RF11_16439 [Thelohanellus kitauei]